MKQQEEKRIGGRCICGKRIHKVPKVSVQETKQVFIAQFFFGIYIMYNNFRKKLRRIKRILNIQFKPKMIQNAS